MTDLAYRWHFILTGISNIIYIILIYFLWKAIYLNTDSVLNGLTFEQTFVYLAFACSVDILFRTWTEWEMSREVIAGDMVMTLIKPIDHMVFKFFRSLGPFMFNCLLVTLPTFVILTILFYSHLSLGINIFFFIIAIGGAYCISFLFDYIIGLTSFYTESIWGISVTKEVVKLLLAGAIIPLKFFPPLFQQIVMYLPFQAVFHTPLSILTDNDLGIIDYVSMIGIQLFWIATLFVITKLFYRRAIKVVTVNGG